MDEELGQFVNPSRSTSNEAAKESIQSNVASSSPFVPTPSSTAVSPRLSAQPSSNPFGLSEEKRKSLEAEERSRIIVRLTRLNSRPDFPQIQFSYTDSLMTLRRLNKVATLAGRQKMNIDFLKRATIFVARMAELLTSKFPNKFIDLSGWAEHLLLTINQYDTLLMDIVELYSDTFAAQSPVMAYIMAIGSNAVMYSITRKLVNNPIVSSLSKMASGGAASQPKETKSSENEERKRQIQEILKRQMKKDSEDTSSIAPPVVSDDEKDDTKSTVSFETLREDQSVASTMVTEKPMQLETIPEKRPLEDVSGEEPRKKKIRFEF